jgi:hypothetical protein
MTYFPVCFLFFSKDFKNIKKKAKIKEIKENDKPSVEIKK